MMLNNASPLSVHNFNEHTALSIAIHSEPDTLAALVLRVFDQQETNVQCRKIYNMNKSTVMQKGTRQLPTLKTMPKVHLKSLMAPFGWDAGKNIHGSVRAYEVA